MKLKTRIAFIVGFFISILLGIISLLVYYDFADFRMEESEDRLKEKAASTVKLLIEVKEIDNQILKLIDRNRINELYNEKTLVFNDSFQLIYSSMDDVVIKWDLNDLKNLKSGGYFFRSQGEYDVLGASYNLEGREYYVLISVEDRFGNRKLNYLGNVLLISFLLGVAVIWIFVFLVIRKMLLPLDTFQEKITEITEKRMTIRLNETGKNDEIDRMAHAFNQMMLRMENAYSRQRDFTSSASHELRTPLARILSQLENLNAIPESDENVKSYIKAISDDVSMMVEKVNSLLLFSRLEQLDKSSLNEVGRLDEMVFDVIDELKQGYDGFSTGFSILGDINESFDKLEIICKIALIKIAISNLLRNAYLYSESHKIRIEIDLNEPYRIVLRIINDGATLDYDDRRRLFSAFNRGKNSQGKQGTGLGLAIAKSIIQLHDGELVYRVENGFNVFEMRFLSHF